MLSSADRVKLVEDLWRAILASLPQEEKSKPLEIVVDWKAVPYEDDTETVFLPVVKIKKG